jgi:hypothetical protein
MIFIDHSFAPTKHRKMPKSFYAKTTEHKLQTIWKQEKSLQKCYPK